MLHVSDWIISIIEKAVITTKHCGPATGIVIKPLGIFGTFLFYSGTDNGVIKKQVYLTRICVLVYAKFTNIESHLLSIHTIFKRQWAKLRRIICISTIF